MINAPHCVYASLMRSLTIAVVLTIAAVTLRADAAADARQTETAFAKAFADRDAAKFFSFVADDAKFFARNRVLAGKAAIIDAWSAYLKDAKAPFRWEPARVETNAAGDLAFSTGPVFDPAGVHIADFSSVWQKQKDGTWKIVFDGPGAPVCPMGSHL